MTRSTPALAAAVLLAMAPGIAPAQGAQVTFSGLKQDTSLPVEVTADQLKVNQSDGTATFTGNVIVGQGRMRLAAPTVRVEYDKGTQPAGRRISRLFASGGVTFTTGTETARAERAVYTVKTGLVDLTGQVILTQGQNAMSGNRLVIDLTRGTGDMQGRVQTIFNPTPNTKPKP